MQFFTDPRIRLQHYSVHPTEITSVDFSCLILETETLDTICSWNPPGWYIVLMIYLHEGANSSTGLMLEDGQMNIGISFTPPQVMTLAGAEMTESCSHHTKRAQDDAI